MKLNTIFYISDNYNDFSNNAIKNSESGITLSYLLQSSDQYKIEEAYRFFNEQTTAQFSLTVIIDTPLDNTYLYYLISFFYLPNYLKIDNQIIINFILKNNNTSNNWQNIFLDLSAKQGIINIQSNVLTLDVLKPNINGQQGSPHLFSNIDNFMLLYTNTLQSSTFYDNIFYVNHLAIEVEKLNSLITTLNNTIKISNPTLYGVFFKLQILSLDNANLKFKNTSLVNELDNFKMHINVLKSVHEATELQTYYDKEYEVLPTWYKRFGHVLKFLMGNRNFKSFFNNK